MATFYPARLLKDHAYALIDRVAVNDTPQDWPLIPIVPPGLENEEHLLPALLLCNEMTATQKVHLLESLEQSHIQGKSLPVVTFIDSDLNQNRLRMHWMNHLLLSLPQGSRALLRSYDPRVFIQLQWMLKPGKLKELFGPITRWTIYLEGGWHTYYPPDVDDSIHYKFDVKQAEQLARIGHINQVLDKLPVPYKHDRISTSKKTDALLLRAKAHNLMREEEQIAFALHGMTIHSDFDSHPQVKRMIDEIDHGEQTYCDAAALLDATIWQKIADELNTSTNTKRS